MNVLNHITSMLTLTARGSIQTSKSQTSDSQILTSEVDPRAARSNIFIIVVDP